MLCRCSYLENLMIIKKPAINTDNIATKNMDLNTTINTKQMILNECFSVKPNTAKEYIY